MEEQIETAFAGILSDIGVGDYEKCEERAKLFSSKFEAVDHAKNYVPYAKYFKTLSETYRIWQVSYDYTGIRSNFRMASYLLQANVEEIFRAKIPRPHRELLGIITILSEVLCHAVWCENAFVNNDHLGLRKISFDARKLEISALRSLMRLSAKDPTLYSIQKWIKDFLQHYRLLHKGFYVCAGLYTEVLGKLVIEDFDRRLAKASMARDTMAKTSEEFASILNAHIWHIQRHYRNLLDKKKPFNTALRVTSGKLVLALSATCDDRWYLEKVYGLRTFPEMGESNFRHKDKFDRVKKGIRDAFSDHSIEVDNFRHLPVQDIFKTTFGSYYSQTIAFDLPSVRLSFSEARQYLFRSSINLSSLGICTLYFELDINQFADPLDDTLVKELSVEDIRLLQSAICPHAGQVRLDFAKTPDYLSVATDLDLAFAWLQSERELLVTREGSLGGENAAGEDKKREIRKYKDEVIYTLEIVRRLKSRIHDRDDSTTTDRLYEDCIELYQEVLERLDGIRRRKNDAAGSNTQSAHERAPNVHSDELTAIIDSLNSNCGVYTYLTDIGALIFRILNQVEVFRTADSAAGEAWRFLKDTGWYTYLRASSISKVQPNATREKRLIEGDKKDERVAFNKIAGHPDTIGFLLEQRESKASFDDWRFAKFNIKKVENLAFVRSHDTDAFFGSEFQAFMYFPYDPMYLIEQYEETVRLMMRLSVILKRYNTDTYHLTQSINDHIFGDSKNKEDFDNKLVGFEASLDKIAELRLNAGKMISLTANASISRYKDHGDLMAKIVRRMDLTSIIESIDRHLENLGIHTRNILTKIAAERAEQDRNREKYVNKVVAVLGLLFSAIAVDNIVKAVSNVVNYPINPTFVAGVNMVSSIWYRPLIESDRAPDLIKNGNEGAWTLIVWVLAAIAIGIWFRKTK